MDEENGRAERVVQKTRVVGEDVRELAGELREAAREVKAKLDLSQSIRDHPIRAVLLAAGVGYVLGGGFFTPLTGRILKLGTRALLVPIVKDQISEMMSGGDEARTA